MDILTSPKQKANLRLHRLNRSRQIGYRSRYPVPRFQEQQWQIGPYSATVCTSSTLQTTSIGSFSSANTWWWMKLQSRCFMNLIGHQKASHTYGSCVREMMDFRPSSTTVMLQHNPEMLHWGLPMESNRERILCVMDFPDTINWKMFAGELATHTSEDTSMKRFPQVMTATLPTLQCRV